MIDPRFGGPRPSRWFRPFGGRFERVMELLGVVLLLAVSAAGCERSTNQVASAWRSDCQPLDRPAPLSLEAAHAAQRGAQRRHELRLREAMAPGSFMREMGAALDPEQMAAGNICPAELAERGRLLFEHEYGFADGLGGEAAATGAGGPFRRVQRGAFGGPETLSCTSCHWIGGANGAGAETDNAILAGDGERMDSGDARNPPALTALGVVQALAGEMSRELQRQRLDLVRESKRAGAEREARLTAKGVDFGVLRATATGAVDTAGIRGVDPDLIVKPFGWKGNFADIAEFASEALQAHLGIRRAGAQARGQRQAIGAAGEPLDPDGNGIHDELVRGPFTALIAHLALLELPIVAPLIQDREMEPAAAALLAPTTTSFTDDFARGRKQFHALGCAGCHVPMLVLENPIVVVDGLPPIDLSREMRQPRLTYEPTLGGYPVWLFSDLRRHDMGENNAAQHVQRGVPAREYLTPRLWGLADSAPYLHDARAPSFDYAIAGHDGEGGAARAAYAELPGEEKGALRVYLMSLRRTSRLTVP